MASIKANFFYSSILASANYIFPLITYPYVSRILGVTNIGICNFVDSIINYFVLFSMMGVTIVGIREVARYKNNKEQLNNVFSGLFWLNTITTTIALFVLISVTLLVDQLRGHWNLMIIGSLKLVMSYLLIEWLYRGLEEFRFITIRTLVIRILYVLSVFLFVKQANDYPVYYLLCVLMITGNAVLNLWYSRRFVSLKLHEVDFSTMIKPYFVLGVYSLLTSMYTSLNVAYLGFVAGETEVGYYTTASKLYYFFIAFFTAFTNVMLPRMSSLLSEGKTDDFKAILSRSNNILFTFSIPFIIFTMVYAPIIIRIIAGEGYEGAILPMQILMPLMLIIGYEQIIIVQGLTPLKMDKAIFINSIIGASMGIMLNIVLVPVYKSVGSSIVWLSCEISVLVSAQIFLQRAISASFPWKKISHSLVQNIPLFFLLYVLYSWNSGVVSLLSAFAILCLYTIVLNTLVFKNPELISLCHLAYNRIISIKR